MAKVTMEQIKAKQEAMVAKAMKLVDLGDNQGEKVAEEAKKLEIEGKQLEAMCKVYEMEQKQAIEERYGRVEPRPNKMVKVELTEAQRKNVHAKTGVWIEVVELEEGAEIHEKTMPSEQPELIEFRAIQKAKGQLGEQAAEADRQKAVNSALADLKAQNNNDINKQLAELMKDPNFLGGAGKK